jgi:hypothetical protein
MDRWDWVYLTVVTQLAVYGRVSDEECNRLWDEYGI